MRQRATFLLWNADNVQSLYESFIYCSKEYEEYEECETKSKLEVLAFAGRNEKQCGRTKELVRLKALKKGNEANHSF